MSARASEPLRRTHRIELTNTARRNLAALPRDVLARVDARILALATDARPPGSKKLAGGSEDLYRVRVGDWRIVYEVRDKVLLVLVIRIAHRREVYRR